MRLYQAARRDAAVATDPCRQRRVHALGSTGLTIQRTSCSCTSGVRLALPTPVHGIARGQSSVDTRRCGGGSPHQQSFQDRDRGPRLTHSAAVPKVAGLVLLVLSAACARRLPEIRGRVVDARTGAPIAGAFISRRLFGSTPINFVDSSKALLVKGGDLRTRSRADGSFVLTAFSASDVVGMDWAVFASGYMSYSAVNCKARWSSDGCTGFELLGCDPWGSAAFTRSGDHLELAVRLTPPTLEGITFQRHDWKANRFVPYKPDPKEFDPWGEYFRRLSRLTQERWLPITQLLDEVLRYIARQEITDEMVGTLAELAQTINRQVRSDLVDERCTVLRTVIEYCSAHPALKTCQWSSVQLGVLDYKNECSKVETTK